MKMNDTKQSATQYGTYTVFPTVARFTGEHGLSSAIRWAKKIKTATPEVNVRIANECGHDLGNVG